MVRATGVGSWPGTDVRVAVRATRDLLADGHLPYLPELPGRGPGSELVGRGAGLLVELPVDLQPSGWRFVDRPGRDARRTAALWRQDLDELAEAYDGYTGELKVQVCGPLTLAAGIFLHRGERALVDEGATRDLTHSLAEGVRLHLADLERLVPGASLVLQVDEPSLPSVLAGRLPTASGYGHLRAVDPQVAAGAIGSVLEAAGDRATVVHCCAPGAPLPLLRRTGAGAVAVDTSLLSPAGWESVAATVEEGPSLYAGCLPTDGTGTAGAAVESVTAGWNAAGLALSVLADIVVSPACGLAGLAPAAARSLQRAAVDAAAELSERAES